MLEIPYDSNLKEIARKIAKVWANIPLFPERRSVFIDFSQWKPNAQTENGEHIIPFLLKELNSLGVTVYPVIKYDYWHDPIYASALKGIHLKHDQRFCIRLNMDVSTIDEINDHDYFSERLSDIIEQLHINLPYTELLIDFNDISNEKNSIEDILDNAKKTIRLARQSKFSQIILAGSSLPSSINLAVKERNSSGFVLRKEMLVWQTLLAENPSLNIIFADYGIRNPKSTDGSKAFPNANGKIRYTIPNKKYFIVRGSSLGNGQKFYQFLDLAQRVVSSEHYLGADFSWGDKQISLYSDPKNGKGTGNQTTWITIDTNHHIETVVKEIEEFMHQLTTEKAREESNISQNVLIRNNIV